jgi:hypothetical protein
MRMVTRASTRRFRNIDRTQAEDSGQEELESKLQARELGRELRLEKEETAVIIEPYPSRILVVLIRLHAG